MRDRGADWPGPPRTDAPAVGLVVGEGMAEEAARAVLRARRNGHPVLVTYRTPRADDAVASASRLGARVVPPGGGASSRSPSQVLADASQRFGYSGLIVHRDLEEHIDYDGSVRELERDTAYVVEARVERVDDVVVAIPAHDEGEAIEGVVSRARSHADAVIVVDDGSSDDTAERAREAGATVYEHDGNRGYGSALKTAFRLADRRSADHLVILDGDGQHDPEDVPKLLDRQRDTGAELVIGSRFSPGSDTELPLYRSVGLWVVNTLVNVGTRRSGSTVRDTQSGFRAYDSRAIRSLAREADIGDHMDASIDVIYHAVRCGYRIEEVGITVDYDVAGASNHNPISHGSVLVTNAVKTASGERPELLVVPGFLVALAGLLAATFLSFGYAPNALSGPVTVTLSSVAFLLGLVACVWGVAMSAVRSIDDR